MTAKPHQSRISENPIWYNGYGSQSDWLIDSFFENPNHRRLP